MSAAIVETVTGASMREIVSARDAASGDLVELRLDGVSDIDVAGAVANRRVPVIVTCRPTWEGGRFDGSEERRLEILSQAIRLGAEFVDVEFAADRRQLPTSEQTTIVLSSHDFSGIPRDLEARAVEMRAQTTGIVKIAATPTTLRDCLRLKNLDRTNRHVLIAMGRAGLLTRLVPHLFGSCWTFGGRAAPGQTPVRALRDVYRSHTHSERTTIYGVAGAPIGHSASPAMHNAALAAVGLDAVYVPLETADADELLEVGTAIGLAGASITVPLKRDIHARTVRHDEVATNTGAVNTIRRAGDTWEGRNFDVAGFLAPLEGRVRLDGARAVVLGSGGAARSAVFGLVSRGSRVEVAARRPEAAAELARTLGAEAVGWPPAPGWDLLVNTTPVGMWPDVESSPLVPASVRGGCLYDLIYNPAETALMRMAREHGIPVIGGLDMLVAQAERQFSWWTGRQPPTGVMQTAGRAFVEQREMQAV